MWNMRTRPIKIFAAAVMATIAGTASAQNSGDLAEEFAAANHTLELITVNNSQLRTRISQQEQLLSEFDETIEYAAMLSDEDESPILGIIEQMISTLEEFIETDLPFHLDSRRGQVELARQLVDEPEAPIRQKFQRLMSLYLAETNYGSTLEAYEDELEINGVETEVDVVRIGRITLAFQSKDRLYTGVWDKNARNWEILDPGNYRTAIQRAIRVASGELASEMIFLPIAAPVLAQ
jgi:hypothetical protein